jgi:S-adenosylmethionine decarboxylase proenzyme
MSIIGKHYIVDIYDVSTLSFEKYLYKDKYDIFDKIIEDLLKINNMTLLQKSIHHFNEEGSFTSLYLLSESHLSFHTWPEYNFIAIDVFTCGSCDPKKIVDGVIDILEPKTFKMINITRGENL